MRGIAVLLAMLSVLDIASAKPALATVYTLGTPVQVALDKLAVGIFSSPEVQRTNATLTAFYLSDPLAETPDGKARIAAARDAIMFASILSAVNFDPDRPNLLWDSAAPHRWGGTEVPGSGYGIDNPDNVYRTATIGGAARYEITGRVTAAGPAQESFVLYRYQPGTRADDKQAVREGSPVLGALTTKDLKTEPDGSFTISLDHDPANGRPNHIQTGENRDERLIVRDTLSDWTTQTPGDLRIRRVGGPPLQPAPTRESIIAHAVATMKIMVPFWIKYVDDYIFTLPKNTIPPPQRRDGGWGMASMGRFDLAPGEALIVTINPLGARYRGFQVTDAWSVAPDYRTRTISLNNIQAEPDADGAITYIVCPQDPGVHNWIDTAGLRSGIAEIRWQDLADKSISPDQAIRTVRVVKLADLAKTLPPDTRSTAPADRREQQSKRAADYARRLDHS